MSEVPRLPVGEYYAGVDLGKKHDPSTLGLVRKEPEHIRLVALKVFPLETEYVAVIGYLRLVEERIQRVIRFLLIRRASERHSLTKLSRAFATSKAWF